MPDSRPYEDTRESLWCAAHTVPCSTKGIGQKTLLACYAKAVQPRRLCRRRAPILVARVDTPSQGHALPRCGRTGCARRRRRLRPQRRTRLRAGTRRCPRVRGSPRAADGRQRLRLAEPSRRRAADADRMLGRLGRRRRVQMELAGRLAGRHRRAGRAAARRQAGPTRRVRHRVTQDAARCWRRRRLLRSVSVGERLLVAARRLGSQRGCDRRVHVFRGEGEAVGRGRGLRV